MSWRLKGLRQIQGGVAVNNGSRGSLKVCIREPRQKTAQLWKDLWVGEATSSENQGWSPAWAKIGGSRWWPVQTGKKRRNGGVI